VLIALLIGSLMVVGNMTIQIFFMMAMVRLLVRRAASKPQSGNGLLFQTWTLSVVVLVLFLGHIVQFGTWAALFVNIGEFPDFNTAFYHSVVNFTSLGYGDIVMSEKWRLLGGLEAANGVLMFGLSAGAILSVMSRVLTNTFNNAVAGSETREP
jgi:hypothetical protein